MCTEQARVYTGTRNKLILQTGDTQQLNNRLNYSKIAQKCLVTQKMYTSNGKFHNHQHLQI